ncbi:endonuclease MutS2 [Clostridium hydrogeniformans]|uniref:endonuclease MutS2 n=1 Tax=Clostridium hydrogeniformans TaxID=349933 RepID=UPI000481430F|nr:endonuclease MutS2 [Clostridium hydrogeniformans]
MNEKALKVLEFNKIKELMKKYTATSAGKDLIEDLVPYNNSREVVMHLKETEEAFNLLLKKGNPPFEGLYDVREGIERAGKGGTLMSGQLIRIANMLRSSRRFKDYISRKEGEEAYYELESLCDGIVPLKKLEDDILFAIISEEEISDRASQTLYNIRRSLKEKNSSIRDRINDVIRSNSKYLQDNLYTVRGDRYVIPVKAEHKGSVPGLVHDQSSSGATLFIEPMHLVNLNNEIRELMLKEKAEIERILADLSQRVYENIFEVKNNSKIIWELDFIFAKAKFSSSINGIMPKVNTDGSFNIIEGRHPLIDPKVVVPSSIYLGEDFTSLVITGPNTGGKTVTLKTAGLLHIMALSGILIPAKSESSVAFYEEIFADIGDEQSIEQSLSTFSSHMTNIVKIIDKSNEKSLVLFDELGAGTDPTEGAALAVSILEYLRSRNVKLVATTHYSELKAYALETESVENASVEFDVETLRPTYRLLIGIPGKSNAFDISRRLGLQGHIIEEAKNLISKDNVRFEDLISHLQEKSIKAEKDARSAEVLKTNIESLKKNYEDKLQGIDKIREKALEEARREARSVLRDAKEEADQILKDMRDLEKMGYGSEARAMLEEQRKTLKDKLESHEEKVSLSTKDKGEKIDKVTLGMEAMLPSLNQKVSILTLPDNKGEVQVEAGIMKINVKLSDLRLIGNGTSSKQDRGSKKREAKLNLRRVESSVDLRGMDAEEACYNADKYLDDAYLGGLNEVSIIHGKGTGVLRNAINEMLRRHPHVKNFRLGEYGEGGTGVTVAVLK